MDIEQAYWVHKLRKLEKIHLNFRPITTTDSLVIYVFD